MLNNKTSKVLLDNWTLGLAFHQLSKLSEYSGNSENEWVKKSCIGNLVTGIILWDNVHYVPNRFTENQFKHLPNNELTKHLLEVCTVADKTGFVDFEPEPEEAEKYLGDEYDYLRYLDDDSVVERAEVYLDWSIEKQINYFPHPLRAEYISDQKIINKMCDYGIRELVINRIDEELIKFYDEVNKKVGQDKFKCAYPVLYDYIRKNSNSPEDDLDDLNVALALRDDKDVVMFRQSLNNLDVMFNSGDIVTLNQAFDEIEEISKTITNKFLKKDHLGQFSIGPIPTYCTSNRILNLTFLTRLFDYGVVVVGVRISPKMLASQK